MNEAAANPVDSPQGNIRPSVKSRIFIVDDHAMFREGLRHLIDCEPDLTVCGDAADADAALQNIDELNPGLVIADISLSGITGIDLIKAIKSKYEDLPVLVVSRHEESLYAERALRAGAAGYVMKQEPAKTVKLAIRKVLGGDIHLSEKMAASLPGKIMRGGQAGRPASPIESLSDREWEVFRMLGEGKVTRQIAEKLDLSIATINSFRTRIKETLNLKNSTELMLHAIQSMGSRRLRRLSRAFQMPQLFVSLICAGRLRPWLAGAAIALGTFTARGDWQLVWSDEFNGVSIDTNHWKFEIGNHHGWGNHELEYYTDRPENVCVSNGVLHIVARAKPADGIFYTSARLKSQGLFAQKYGRFEFRAKFPGGQGYWPALWLMPEHSAYGRWPASGEIDIMENKGNDPAVVRGTIHYAGADGRHLQSTGKSTFPRNDGATNFHVYLLEWTTNTINWQVDGRRYETQTNWSTAGAAYPAPFNQPFYIIMNLAVGGDYGGNPDAHTVFPGELQVDYIRVYDNVATNSVR